MVARVRGMLNVAGIKRSISEVLGSHDWQPGRDIIWDGREITSMDLLPGDIDRVARFVEQRMDAFGDGRAALITADEFQYSLARLHGEKQRRAALRRIGAFYRMEDALLWLGLPADLVP